MVMPEPLDKKFEGTCDLIMVSCELPVVFMHKQEDLMFI